MDDMKKNRISAGSEMLDNLLEGGYERDIVTTIYGPAGAGKTLLCMLAVTSCVKEGKKAIYIDTEGGFSVERFEQVVQNARAVLEKTVFLHPTSFEGQRKVFERLKTSVNERVGLIVVDTIGMLYKIERGKSDDIYDTNQELGLQLSFLSEIARKKKIPVLIANQVYADFDNPNSVKLVGGDIIRYSSKCLLEIEKAHAGKRKITVRKHRSIAEGKDDFFEIVEKGIVKIDKFV
jgi:DNA repair protein RadB